VRARKPQPSPENPEEITPVLADCACDHVPKIWRGLAFHVEEDGSWTLPFSDCTFIREACCSTAAYYQFWMLTRMEMKPSDAEKISGWVYHCTGQIAPNHPKLIV